MFEIIAVKALPEHRLRLTFSDGVSGEVDVSYLAGKGVFAKWDRPGEFEKVGIGSSGELIWGEDVDLCPDALYMKITNKKPEELFPSLKRDHEYA